MKIMVTGGAGYIGKILVNDLCKRNDVENVIVIDRKAKPEDFDNPKISYYSLDLAQNLWEEFVKEVPDFIVHCAFDIRSPYRNISKQEFINLEACKRIFEYCFKYKIKKIVYLSSAAAYGARERNIGRLLKEDDSLIEKDSPYGSQKRRVEEILAQKIAQNNFSLTQVFVLRLATVNGKEGERRKNPSLMSWIKNVLPILPYSNDFSARQYVNEEDVLAAINMLLFSDIKSQYEVFNLAPDDFLTIKDMAQILNKKAVKIPVIFVRIAFFLAWHLSMGYIPTPRGAWKSFVYPSNMDGSLIKKFGFNYRYNSKDTFLSK
ncbi:MAG TPA: NAD-dependent epimerase/dehydratase family protein [Candidatus Pacearchaeota archaeon]|nr:NAD-dependent epimerase/dehydratase family protein [Candidatus Pacearchaeota archaeon]HOU46056.1 NAD-dependent epimerase/dehydratase family protein [Candidatus Pacearchaeota archaeon]HPM08690.1 NAD-dependent epimerase/dehydratase family protein [Candidatus Pacearchaeota archaeon]HQI74863.1 NAD-dependent epimerase/dehydratase family protein [Candidatus Pacearchaeota archaeon]